MKKAMALMLAAALLLALILPASAEGKARDTLNVAVTTPMTGSFFTAQWGNNTTAPSYQTTGSQRYDSRFVSLGLTWRMGKMELESKARQGATESMGTPQI